MTTAYTSLLGLALPVTGELSGTWGNTVNTEITSLLDSAIAGTTTISTDADITLTTTTGAANESREAIILWTAAGTVTRNITAPAQSKTYIVINKSSSTQSIVLRGAGPTTGVTIIKGEAAVCAWNGSDFIKVSNISGAGVFSSITNTGLTSGRVVFSTTGGLETDSANLLYAGTDLTVYGLTVGRGGSAVGSNTVVGASALAANTSGVGNTAVGLASLAGNTSGADNAAFGYASLQANTSGVRNSAFGGSGVGFDGIGVLGVNTSGSDNAAFGNRALKTNTTGSNNTALGSNALFNNTTASSNTAVGYQAGYSNTTGSSLVAVGIQAAYSNTTGLYNVAIGENTLRSNTTASGNTGVGTNALYANTTGTGNTATGGYDGTANAAMRFNTTGSYNSAYGVGALASNTTAPYNTAVGYQAGYSYTTSGYITAIGYRAGYSSNAGGMTAIGANVLYNNTGNGNVGVGGEYFTVSNAALYANTSGASNTAVGVGALTANTTASNNTAVGYQAGYSNTTAPSNTAVGYQALYSLTTGNGQNTAVGYQAGYATQGGAENNNYFGNFAGGTVTTGNGNVCLGHYAGTNTLAVFHITTQSDRIVVGNSLSTNAYIQVAWTVTSDARDKVDVAPSTYGLEFVNKLKPVTFKWDKRSSYELDNTVPDGSKKQSKTQLGFLAQDVIALEKEFGAAAKDLLIADDEQNESLKITETKMIPVLVKAIQELKAEFDAYKSTHP